MDEVYEERRPLLRKRRPYRRGAMITAAIVVASVGACGIGVVALAAANVVGAPATTAAAAVDGVSDGLDLWAMGLGDAGCAYKSSMEMVVCYNVSNITANVNVSVDLYLPEGATSLVVVVPGSGWCGLDWSAMTSEMAWDQACKLVTPRGFACAAVFYGVGQWPRQHVNAMSAINWTRTLGFAKTGLIGDSSGAGLAFYAWARAKELALPIDVAGMIGPDVFLCPIDPPHLSDECILSWSKDDDYEVDNYPYAVACNVDVGADANMTSCEGSYTHNCDAEAARESLGLHYVTSDAVPIMFGHGAVDTCIECDNSPALYDFVHNLGVDTDIHIQHNASHIHYWAGPLVPDAFLSAPFAYAENETYWPEFFIPKILDFFESRGIPSSVSSVSLSRHL